MPTPLRMTIRDAMATRCAGLDTGAGVTSAPFRPQLRADLPSIFVWLGDEAVERDGSGRRQFRQCELHVAAVARVAPGTALDDALETMAAEIMAAVGADDLAGAVDQLFLTDITKETDEAGEHPAGSIRLTFAAQYRDAAADPYTRL